MVGESCGSWEKRGNIIGEGAWGGGSGAGERLLRRPATFWEMGGNDECGDWSLARVIYDG